MTKTSPYGFCPKCGKPGVSRERRPNGDDTCLDGHKYPSRDALAVAPKTEAARKAAPFTPPYSLGQVNKVLDANGDLVARCAMQWEAQWLCNTLNAASGQGAAGVEARGDLAAAIEPFLEVVAWAERNGCDLTKDVDMIQRTIRDGIGDKFGGHLGVQGRDFVALAAAYQSQRPVGAPGEDRRETYEQYFKSNHGEEAFRIYDDLIWPFWQAALSQPASEQRQVGVGEIDAIMSGLYRRFKDWSKRGFGPDDVTWCEVRADVLKLLAASPSPPARAELTGREQHDIANIRLLNDTGQLVERATISVLLAIIDRICPTPPQGTEGEG